MSIYVSSISTQEIGKGSNSSDKAPSNNRDPSSISTRDRFSVRFSVRMSIRPYSNAAELNAGKMQVPDPYLRISKMEQYGAFLEVQRVKSHVTPSVS